MGFTTNAKNLPAQGLTKGKHDQDTDKGRFSIGFRDRDNLPSHLRKLLMETSWILGVEGFGVSKFKVSGFEFQGFRVYGARRRPQWTSIESAMSSICSAAEDVHLGSRNRIGGTAQGSVPACLGVYGV